MPQIPKRMVLASPDQVRIRTSRLGVPFSRAMEGARNRSKRIAEVASTDTRLLPAGDTALVVEFGDRVERRLSAQVLAFYRRVMNAGIPGVVEGVPTLRSLIVHYDPVTTSAKELGARLLPLMDDLPEAVAAARLWRIPACYDPSLAPDVVEVGERTGLSAEAVAELHASVPYSVYMLGFLPGLPYMGELPEKLRLARRVTPRTRLPAGSVAIATNMTIVYPLESPGGWHLIGRTPVRLFDTGRASPALLAPGDTVRFHPISVEEFERLSEAIAAGAWDLAPEEEGT
jgi:KipI family sensor histidine kinase inhibitor